MRSQRTVMIVDDDPLMLEQAAQRLKKVGYRIVTRDQALGSSTAILAEKPDIVMLDVHMPGLSGDRLAGVLRDHKRLLTNMIVILHSTLPLAELQTIARSVGAAGAITKTANDALFEAQFQRIAQARAGE